MEPLNKQSIKPPAGTEVKKVTGSFVRRNNWLIIIGTAIILIVAAMWLAYQKIKTITREALQDTTISDKQTSKADVIYEKDTVFKESYNSNIKLAKLNLRAGATNYILKDTTNSLLIADTKAFKNRYQLSTSQQGSMFTLDLSSTHVKQPKNINNDADSVSIKLNRNSEWKIDINAGVTTIDFDLTRFKVSSINVKGGAGDYKLKLGEPLTTTNLIFDTGVSEITVSIPKDAACHIKTNAQLSSNSFDGFDDKGSGEFETKGFAATPKKILIEFKGGISDYKVTRY